MRKLFSSFASFDRNAVLLLTISALGGIIMGAMGVLFNLYLLHFGYTAAFLGNLVFISSVSGLLTALPAGWLSDRWSPLRLLQVIIPFLVVAGAGQALFVSPGAQMGLMALNALGFTVIGIVSTPLIMLYSGPDQRTALFSANAAISMGAGVLGSLLGGGLPSLFMRVAHLPEVTAQRNTLLVVAAIGAAALIPALLMRRTPAEGSISVIAATLKGDDAGAVPERPTARPFPLTIGLLILYQALVGLGAGLFVPFFNVFLNRHLGASTAQVGWIMGLQSVGIMAVTLLAPALARRLGTIQSALSLQALSLPFLVVMATVPSLWIVGAASAARSALMNAANPAFSAYSMEIIPSGRRALVTSLLMVVWNGGWALSAKIAGVMMVRSYTAPYWITLALYGAGCLLGWAAFVRPRAPVAASRAL